jgi:hypothetical protein
MNKDLSSKIRKENTLNPEFKSSAVTILKDNSNLFVFSRYLSNKDYFHLKTEKEFDDFLNNRIEKECLTLFKNKFEIINFGIVGKELIEDVKIKIGQNEKIDWVIIGKNNDNTQWSTWINNEEDFEDIIEDEFGKEVIIIKDQNWFNEEETIHAYIPDKYGIVRKGSY